MIYTAVHRACVRHWKRWRNKKVARRGGTGGVIIPVLSFVWLGSEKHETCICHTGLVVVLSAGRMPVRKGERRALACPGQPPMKDLTAMLLPWTG